MYTQYVEYLPHLSTLLFQIFCNIDFLSIFTVMKRIFLFLLLLAPLFAIAQNYKPTTPAGSTSFTPTFRYKDSLAVDSLRRIWLSSSGKWYQISTVGISGGSGGSFLPLSFPSTQKLITNGFGLKMNGNGKRQLLFDINSTTSDTGAPLGILSFQDTTGTAMDGELKFSRMTFVGPTNAYARYAQDIVHSIDTDRNAIPNIGYISDRFLRSANNLSDVASLDTSQKNLGFQTIWHRRGIVLYPSTSADQQTNGEPTVIREASPHLITGADTVFKMWYTQGWTTSNICYAESLDGVSWVKRGTAVVANRNRSFVLKNGSTYYMYAANLANTQLDQFTSSDGITWTLAHSAVITAAGSGWATGIFSPFVFIEGGTWKMLVDGLSSSIYGEGYYTSSDGITWTQPATNPVITYTGENPYIFKIGSTYWLYGHGNPATSILPCDIYRQSSTDLIHWSSAVKVFARQTADEGASLSTAQVSDISMMQVDSSVYLWYTATPDGGAQSGVAHIKLAVANMTLKQLVTTREGTGGDIVTQQPPFIYDPSTQSLSYTSGNQNSSFNLAAPLYPNLNLVSNGTQFGQIGSGNSSIFTGATDLDIIANGSGNMSIEATSMVLSAPTFRLPKTGSFGATSALSNGNWNFNTGGAFQFYFNYKGSATQQFLMTNSGNQFTSPQNSNDFLFATDANVSFSANGGTQASAYAQFRASDKTFILNGGGSFTSTGSRLQTTSASFGITTTAKIANYTLGVDDNTVTGDATSGAFNFTVPTAVGIDGRDYILKKIDASANAITVAFTSGQTGDGASTIALASQNDFVDIRSNGANWWVVAKSATGGAPSGTAGGELAGTYPNPTLLNSAVIAKVLTGYTSGAGTVASTDNILQAIQKLNGNDALKAPIASPTFTGTVTIPNGGVFGTPTSMTATNVTGLPLSTGVTGILPVANGGTGTASPGIVAGTNVTVTGTWPNQTVNASGGGTPLTAGRGILLPSTAIILDTTQNYNWLKGQTITKNALGATTLAGLTLQNTTAAALGAQQDTPFDLWSSNGWSTTNSASRNVSFLAFSRPVQGAANPTGLWHLQSSINGGAFGDVFTIDNGGTANFGNSVNTSGSFIASSLSTLPGMNAIGNNFHFPSLAGVGTSGNSAYEFDGNAFNYRVVFSGGTQMNIVASQSAANYVFTPSATMVTAASGTNNIIANVAFKPQTFTATAGSTVTNAVNAYFGGAPIGTATNKYNIWAKAVNRFSGAVVDSAFTLTAGNATITNGNVALGTAGNKITITEGTNGSVGQVALVAGTKAISITGVTTSTRAFVTLVSQGGTVTTTTAYAAVCTSGTVTITALTNAGTTDTTDTSLLNYFVIN